jgi:CMP-N-acetylneuraminic acid synthetase
MVDKYIVYIGLKNYTTLKKEKIFTHYVNAFKDSHIFDDSSVVYIDDLSSDRIEVVRLN